jgi:hypothetical protein
VSAIEQEAAEGAEETNDERGTMNGGGGFCILFAGEIGVART